MTEERKDKPSEQNPGGGAATQKTTVGSRSMCPRCGGLPHRNKWKDVFTLNLTTFFIFGALASFMVPFFVALHCVAGGVLVLAWLAVVAISLFALPITGAAAVAARPRCSLCGHPFWPASDIPTNADEDRFPIRFALVGAGIALASLLVGFVWFFSAPGQETIPVGFEALLRIVLAVLILGVEREVSLGRRPDPSLRCAAFRMTRPAQGSIRIRNTPHFGHPRRYPAKRTTPSICPGFPFHSPFKAS